MNQLEWAGTHSKAPQVGHVVAYSGSVDHHGFGIWIKSYGTTHCSFGEVSAGLEVVEAAMGHDPVTQVTITHCGLVIPDLVP